ncbi:MAG: hypothetical protein K0R57_207 [Paenibacillaceae bacterium]|nr:hypothetical protein [Paenibacillaceae bacterium]
MKKDYDFIVTHVERVIERKHTAEWAAKNISNSNNYILVIALSGEAKYLVDDTEMQVAEDDVYLFPPHSSRSARSNPGNPWHFISISFQLQFLNDSEQDLIDNLCYVIHNAPGHIKKNVVELCSVWTGRNTAYQVKCRTLLQEILYQLILLKESAIHNPAHFQKIEAIRQYIQRNYSETFSIEELADKAGFSPSHFRKLFREIVGMTATQYAISIRINKAKDLLLSGEANVTEAALLAGFKDVFYFSTLFKKHTGSNPSQIIN